MLARFADVCLARLPREALPTLAPLRTAPVQIHLDEQHCWLRWEGGDDAILGAVLPAPGVQLYVRRDGEWHRLGARFPETGVPEGGYRPLHSVLFPATFQRIVPEQQTWERVAVRLVADHGHRPTAALLTGVAELLSWMDSVPTARFGRLRAALRDDLALVRGPRLPLLAHGERFWGERVLRPLGMCTAPELPESALLEVFGVSDGEMLLLRPEQSEVVPFASFAPLTRAGLRGCTGEAS